MKFRKDRNILKFFGVSLGFILVGIIILLFIQPKAIIGVVSISSGLMGLIIGLRLASKPPSLLLPAIFLRELFLYGLSGFTLS